MEEVEKARVLTEKAREEAKKAKDEAEQHGYDVGMAETEDALRTEVLNVCRTYCALTWDKALNQVGVEASSVLRKAGSVYYPPAICLSSSSNSKADPVPSEVGEAQGSPPKAPPATNTSSEAGEQAKDTTRAGDVNEGTVQGADLAPTVPGDLLKEKETSQSMELVLVTFAIPPKVDPKDKAQVPSHSNGYPTSQRCKGKTCNKDEKVVVYFSCYLAAFVRGLNLMKVAYFLLMILVFMLPLL